MSIPSVRDQSLYAGNGCIHNVNLIEIPSERFVHMKLHWYRIRFIFRLEWNKTTCIYFILKESKELDSQLL